jgi:hypothetical protein
MNGLPGHYPSPPPSYPVIARAYPARAAVCCQIGCTASAGRARDPALVGRPFFAHFDPRAKWLTDLEPAFADRFPFELDPHGHDAAALPGLWPDELVEPAAS